MRGGPGKAGSTHVAARWHDCHGPHTVVVARSCGARKCREIANNLVHCFTARKFAPFFSSVWAGHINRASGPRHGCHPFLRPAHTALFLSRPTCSLGQDPEVEFQSLSIESEDVSALFMFFILFQVCRNSYGYTSASERLVLCTNQFLFCPAPQLKVGNCTTTS